MISGVQSPKRIGHLGFMKPFSEGEDRSGKAPANNVDIWVEIQK